MARHGERRNYLVGGVFGDRVEGGQIMRIMESMNPKGEGSAKIRGS